MAHAMAVQIIPLFWQPPNGKPIRGSCGVARPLGKPCVAFPVQGIMILLIASLVDSLHFPFLLLFDLRLQLLHPPLVACHSFSVALFGRLLRAG